MVYYKRVQNNSSILAEFGIKIVKWGLTFYKMKLIQGKNGGTFITGPSEKYKDFNTGEEKYAKFWSFDKEQDEKFQKEVKRFVEEYIAALPKEEVSQQPLDEDAPF